MCRELGRGQQHILGWYDHRVRKGGVRKLRTAVRKLDLEQDRKGVKYTWIVRNWHSISKVDMKNKIIFNTDSNFMSILKQKHGRHWLSAGTIVLQSDMYGWSPWMAVIIIAIITVLAFTEQLLWARYCLSILHPLIPRNNRQHYHPYFYRWRIRNLMQLVSKW